MSSKILTDVKIGVEHMAHKLQHLKAVRYDEEYRYGTIHRAGLAVA